MMHHEVLRVDSNGRSERVRDEEQPWQEELVMALVRRGYTLSEAILIAATACMRCRCVLAYELGLDYGYAYGSPEYEATDSDCELCQSKG